MQDYKPLTLRFTEHAAARAQERFNGDLRMPEHLIYKMFRRCPDGTIKKLKYGDSVLIMTKRRDIVDVITVYQGEEEPRLTKDCKRKYGRWKGEYGLRQPRRREGVSIGEWDEYWN
jgi:hypothetical protein